MSFLQMFNISPSFPVVIMSAFWAPKAMVSPAGHLSADWKRGPGPNKVSDYGWPIVPYSSCHEFIHIWFPNSGQFMTNNLCWLLITPLKAYVTSGLHPLWVMAADEWGVGGKQMVNNGSFLSHFYCLNYSISSHSEVLLLPSGSNLTLASVVREAVPSISPIDCLSIYLSIYSYLSIYL